MASPKNVKVEERGLYMSLKAIFLNSPELCGEPFTPEDIIEVLAEFKVKVDKETVEKVLEKLAKDNIIVRTDKYYLIKCGDKK